jgi:hypothetical protein
MPVQVGPDGKVTYDDVEGDQGSTWDYLSKHLPRALGQTFGEAVTPSLNAVGGEQNAQDYITKQLASDPNQEWSWAREVPKAVGRAASQVFVPKSSVDLQGQVLGLGAGELLGGASAAKNAVAASQAASKASGLTKLQEASKAKGATSSTARPGTGAGYHTRRAIGAESRKRGVGEKARQGPKPSEQEIALSTKARYLDRGRKGGDTPTTYGPLNEPMKPSFPSGTKAPPQSVGQKVRANQLTPEQSDALDQLVRQRRGGSVGPTPSSIAGPEADQAFGQMRRDATKELTGRMRSEQLEEGTQKMYNEQAAEGLRQPSKVPETGNTFQEYQDLPYEQMLAQNPGAGAGKLTDTTLSSTGPSVVEIMGRLREQYPNLSPQELAQIIASLQ